MTTAVPAAKRGRIAFPRNTCAPTVAMMTAAADAKPRKMLVRCHLQQVAASVVKMAHYPSCHSSRRAVLATCHLFLLVEWETPCLLENRLVGYAGERAMQEWV